MIIKRLIPDKIKLFIKLGIRHFKGLSHDFASTKKESKNIKFKISTLQEIKQGKYFENKVHNIYTASQKIANIILYPNQVFSFWKIIGNPNNKNVFKIGRNLINGEISEEIAGGICQLSSIIYFTALKANLKILERHNHSIDIYKEIERFTPLGADATVVYGNKDLIFQNNLKFPIVFNFTYNSNYITCTLESENEITEASLEFKRTYIENKIIVHTLINDKITYQSSYNRISLEQ